MTEVELGNICLNDISHRLCSVRSDAMKSNQMFVLLDLALSQEVFRKTPPYEHVKKVQSFISQK